MPRSARYFFLRSISIHREETVVLLHGLGRGPWSMQRLAARLAAEGYRVINFAYSSRSQSIESLAYMWLPARLHEQGADTADRLNFVTHSMGGIMVRLWLREQMQIHHGSPPANLGRVVMLAPPNQGSQVADHLAHFLPFRWFTGVNGAKLGTGPGSLPSTLGPWPTDIPLGIIAGDRSFNPLFSAWLPGKNDGKVAVTNTRLDGVSAWRVLHHSHTWLPVCSDTGDEVIAFLRTGHFQDKNPTAASLG